MPQHIQPQEQAATLDSWQFVPPIEPAPELVAAIGGHPLVAQLLAQRGYPQPEQALAFVDPERYQPAPPAALAGVDEAARLLQGAVDAGLNILVWGDFDVDGQSSTSLLVSALRSLAGPERVRFHVPQRATDGHGIQVTRLAERLADPSFRPDVLLTCDTGIAEAPAICYAKENGLTVIITDHHDLTPELAALRPGRDRIWGLPVAEAGAGSVRSADAIVNPKFQPAGDPMRTLPGVGVAYKLVQQLYSLAGRAGEETALLDLVALGIVADVAEQVHDARYLLQRGLACLRTTRRVGLLALMDVARLTPSAVDAEAIGFQLGPRMNAVGRLDDAAVAVELLTTRNATRARQLAATMERLNQERRLLTSQTTAAALEMVDRNPNLLDFSALVLQHHAWHPGIVGIVAARLAEEFRRPVVLLITAPGQPARGSARSVPGVDIGAAIAACADLLIQFGGHPGAAGLSLLAENVDPFRRRLHQQVDAARQGAARSGEAAPTVVVDAQLHLHELSLSLAEELQRLAPFGNGNPAPRFLSAGLQVVDDRRMGRDGTHRRLQVAAPDQATASVIWFNGADAELPSPPLDLVYTLGVNEYRGERSLQVQFVAARSTPAEPAVSLPGGRRMPRLHDLRRTQVDPEHLPQPPAAVWYAEGAGVGAGAAGPAYAPRTAARQAQRGAALVLWSIPPSRSTLTWLLDTVQPAEIYVCSRATSDERPDLVLRQVAGMCKFALGHDGLLDISRMAARLGLTEAAVRHALLLLESRGRISIDEWSPAGADSLRIRAGEGAPRDEEQPLLWTQLVEQLAEVRAFRRFFQGAAIDELGLDTSP